MVSFTDSPGRRVKFRGVTEIVALSGAVADARYRTRWSVALVAVLVVVIVPASFGT